MRQGLQLKFSQQLKMTPQLQQAIKLLQLSTLDLQQEIIEQLYNNPLLESDEEAASHEPSTKDSSSNKDVDLSDDSDLYMKAQDAYYLANAQASYDDWRRARRQWDYFYRRK